jgi:hypothetical protein
MQEFVAKADPNIWKSYEKEIDEREKKYMAERESQSGAKTRPDGRHIPRGRTLTKGRGGKGGRKSERREWEMHTAVEDHRLEMTRVGVKIPTMRVSVPSPTRATRTKATTRTVIAFVPTWNEEKGRPEATRILMTTTLRNCTIGRCATWP